MSSRRVSRVIVAAMTALVLVGGSFANALAGTTGSITGTVVDADTHQPIADATVTAASPSQRVTAHSDAGGKYVFLSLAPDTYTVSAQHEGYEPVTVSGISVFADQSQTVTLTARKSLKTIAQVTSRSSLSPVKPGTTTDVYSVNPALTAAAAPIGGGGGLNNAYSAIATMPGAFVPPNQMGVNQTVYIRGGYYDQIGYEYDGVPVNRSFDNYPAHSASTLGQQELQIYTGGGPASSNATGLAGFINQVVKSGTYPGFGTGSARVGSPTFYHDLSVEAGGASPNRLFSYYAGISGFNQDFRYLDNSNGADLINEFPVTYPSNITTNLAFWPAVYPTCNPFDPNLYENPATSYLWNDPGCFGRLGPQFDNVSRINGREAVVNFHFGLPHRYDAGRDDIQLLYTSSAQYRQYYSSANDAQPLLNALEKIGYAYPPQWPDFYTYPSGTKFLSPADVPVIGYMFPGSPTNRCINQTGVGDSPLPIPNGCTGTDYAPLPNDYRDARWDTASIVKLQYQKNIGSNAYLRLYGYTFYSNTNRSGAVQQGITGPYGSVNLGATNYDYEVGAHTRGAQLQFADQISDTNQIAATLNYVTATTLRYYNFNQYNTASQQVSNLTNGTQCFAYTSGTLANGIESVNQGAPAPCNDPITQGTFEYPTAQTGATTINCSAAPPAGYAGTAACTGNAAWLLTFTGNQGEINSITPKFSNVALTDEWKPNDKLDVNASVRFERDEFDLTPVSSPAKNFWYAAAQREFCYDTKTLQPVIVPQPPRYAKNITPFVSFDCAASGDPNAVHPDGKDGHILLTDQFNTTYTQSYFEPRFGVTYSVDPDTVLRFSAGRYAQQPQNYEVEYNSLEPNLAAELIGFLPFGYNTPLHQAQAQFSNNFDFSYEHRFRGTDLSVKLTPYYRYATQQLYETVSIPTLFGVSPSFNSGTERTSGIEIEVTKGDFNRNGLAGVFSYTYTNSKEKWANYGGTNINPVDPYNQDIQNFNQLTKAGGGAQCYVNNSAGQVLPDPGCATVANYNAPIFNPYYGMSPQPLLDKFGWYDTGLDYPYVSPNTFALVLSYRHNRFSITPALTLYQGATYGTPADFQGLDPRTCSENQGDEGVTGAPSPYTADYTSCHAAAIGASGSNPGHLYIPNPYTGKFDTFGQFKQPWQLNLGLQLTYDISPRLTANLTIANLVNTCFGGSSEPWTKAYPPSNAVCGYGYNKFYISNYYNGSSPSDIAANGVSLNKYFTVPFSPAYGDVNSANLPLPLQFYFQVQVKI